MLAHPHNLDQAILDELRGRGTCEFEALVIRFSAYSWNQVFGAVDRLARESKVVVLSPNQSSYVVAVHPVAHLSRSRALAYR